MRRTTIAVLIALVVALLPGASLLAQTGDQGRVPGPSDPPADTTVGSQDPLTGVAQVVAGTAHACARMVDGTARCWGYGKLGALGNRAPLSSARPVTVVGDTGVEPLRGITQLAAGGNSTCARLLDGTARCWGSNSHGQLGDNSGDASSAVPRTVMNVNGTGSIRDVVQVTVGYTWACAWLTDGQARCWGDNSNGQLGDNTTIERHLPVAVLNGSGTGPLQVVTQVAAGQGSASNFTCARLSTRQARCWGRNDQGRLGDNSTIERHLPTRVLNPTAAGPLQGVTRITAGQSHACAQLDDQAVCWGSNEHAGLGDGTSMERHLPVNVHNPADTGPLVAIAQVNAGFDATCAVLANGRVVCWGDRFAGQLGDGLDETSNPKVQPGFILNEAGSAPFGGVAQLDAGDVHTCFRSADGTAGCTGYNFEGELGNGSAGAGSVRSLRPTFVIA